MRHETSAGVTLLELLLALVLLGLLTAMAGVSGASLSEPPVAATVQALQRARATALTRGQPVSWTDGTVTIRFLPDGSSSGGWVQAEGLRLWVDPLTGGVHAGD